MPYKDTERLRRIYLREQAKSMADLAAFLRRRAEAKAPPLPLLSWEVWPQGVVTARFDLMAIGSDLTIRQVLEMYAAAMHVEVTKGNLAGEPELRVVGNIGPRKRTLVQLTAWLEDADQRGKAVPEGADG